MFSWRRGQPYSQDLRERVLAADELSAREAAERFEVSVSYVVKARQRRARLGDVRPGAQRCWVPCKLASRHTAIAAYVRQHQDATLSELRAWLLSEFGVSASIGTMWNTLRRLGLTLKKRRSRRASAGVPISQKPASSGTS
jgi:transposase